MKRILITGGHSYIGTAIAERLKTQPDRYTAETLSLRGRSPDGLDFRGVDAIVHVAAIVHRKETRKTQALFDAINRDLAVAIAEKAKREGVKQFVFFSTMAVYGLLTGRITADTVPAPATQYGRSKLQAEHRIAPLADESFAVAILRAPVVFGPGAKGNPAKLERLAKRLPFCPDFENRRSMVSIETLCDTVLQLLEAPRAGLFFPQEQEPVSTCALIEQSMRAQGGTPRKTKVFNPVIRVLRACTGVGKKAFGDLVYEGPFEQALPAANGEEIQH